jgi:pimeloyl-ACP methyl ester carboxylesterase
MQQRRTFLAASAAFGAAAAVNAAPARKATPRLASGRLALKDGTELFVKDWGSGPTVVLTHSWPFSSDCWDHHALALADAGFRVIAYDRRGFGRSSQPDGGYDYDTFADDLAQVVEATGARDVTLVGYSMGGGEVVRYLSRHGARAVRKVALVASVVPGLGQGPQNPHGVPPAFFEGLKASLRADRATFLADLLRDVFYDTAAPATFKVTQAVLDWSWRQAMQAGLRALVSSVDAFGSTDFRGELAGVEVPALVLHGTGDKPVPIDLTARPAAAGIRQARLVEYEGVSHGLLVTERERVRRDLLEFLKG